MDVNYLDSGDLQKIHLAGILHSYVVLFLLLIYQTRRSQEGSSSVTLWGTAFRDWNSDLGPVFLRFQ